MTHGILQPPQVRHIRAVAPVQRDRDALPDQNAVEAELDGWRRNDARFFAHRVDVLERQLRRRTWILGSALLVSLGAAAALAMPQLRPLLPELKLRLMAGSDASTGNSTPAPKAIAPEPSQQPTTLQRLTAPDL